MAKKDETVVEDTQVDEAPVVAPTPPSALHERLHNWMYGHLAGGPLSRNTECWNAVHAALPALEDIINAAPAEKE